MLGAIAGDIIGSTHEWARTKSKDFDLFAPGSTFTDDSVMTVAVAECLLDSTDYVDAFHRYFDSYPSAGYGGMFLRWAARKRREPYHSYSNGAAMRVSPIAWALPTLEGALAEAARSAAVTHDHPEGIRGAEAVTAAIFLARQGEPKTSIGRFVSARFGYDLSTPLDDIRPHYDFDGSSQGSVPQSIIAFLESTGYEDAVRNAISLGGDADTMACIAGAIAEAFYGSVPAPIENRVLAVLDPSLTSTMRRFRDRYCSGGSDLSRLA